MKHVLLLVIVMIFVDISFEMIENNEVSDDQSWTLHLIYKDIDDIIPEPDNTGTFLVKFFRFLLYIFANGNFYFNKIKYNSKVHKKRKSVVENDERVELLGSKRSRNRRYKKPGIRKAIFQFRLRCTFLF